jgi:hypothetical protein
MFGFGFLYLCNISKKLNVLSGVISFYNLLLTLFNIAVLIRGEKEENAELDIVDWIESNVMSGVSFLCMFIITLIFFAYGGLGKGK